MGKSHVVELFEETDLVTVFRCCIFNVPIATWKSCALEVSCLRCTIRHEHVLVGPRSSLLMVTKRSTLSDVVFGHFRLLGSLGTARQSYRRGFHQNHPLYMFNHGIENLDPLKKRISRISITEYGPFRRKMHFWWSSHVGKINKPRRCVFS